MNSDHEDESVAGEPGTPIDIDREWDGFVDVNPNLSFIVDVLTPLCRFKRFTISCRKSRKSTAYSRYTLKCNIHKTEQDIPHDVLSSGLPNQTVGF